MERNSSREDIQRRQNRRRQAQRGEDKKMTSTRRNTPKKSLSAGSGRDSISRLQLCLQIDSRPNNQNISDSGDFTQDEVDEELSVSGIWMSVNDHHTHQQVDPDEASHTSSNCSNDTAQSHGEHSSAEIFTGLAPKEAQKATRWKTFVMVLLLINAVLVITITFEFLHRQEISTFESAFQRAAKTLNDASHYHAQSLAESMQTFSDTVTSHALDSNTTFPFLDLPHFEQRAAHVRHNGFLDLFGIVPLVPIQDRDDWNRFASDHQNWIWQSYQTINELQREAMTSSDTSHHHDRNHIHPNLPPKLALLQRDAIPDIPTGIYTSVDMDDDPLVLHNTPQTNTTYYAPLWQLSPPPPLNRVQIINADLLANEHFYQMVQVMNLTDHIAVSPFLDWDLYQDPLKHIFRSSMHGNSDTKDDINKTGASSSILQQQQSRNHSPRSIFLQPIYDSFEKHNGRSIQAFAIGVVLWEHYLSDLLPVDVNDGGIHAVLKNSCGQVMTLLINGTTATYLGDGDQHEQLFNHLAVHTVFEEFRDNHPLYYGDDENIDGHNNYTNTNNGTCHYSMTIYPSAQFRLTYHSQRPELFTLGMACIFIFTGFVFWAFIYVSQRKQQKVMAVAMSSNLIIRSMFPSNVVNQILRDAEEEAMRKLEEGKRGKLRVLKSKKKQKHQQQQLTSNALPSHESGSYNAADDELYQSFLPIPATSQDLDNKAAQPFVFPQSKPIAELYPEVTILVADIVDFTAWSSVREPHQIFTLLEAIYMTFDQIATRRKVFKVETNGDCYVACCGIPSTRQDHAIVMCRYARECYAAFEVLIKRLERSLGPETSELSMRYGLHSGPVTAGVLRGERSRFQLFGDTVNTAARMERNSLPGYIQISQDTAELLAVSKKSSWFSPRDDRVVAKGKGELQTYWLHAKKEDNEKSEGSSVDGDSSDWLMGGLEMPEPSIDALRLSLSEQNQRLADWNSNQLLKLLNRVSAQRKARCNPDGTSSDDQVFIENAHQRWAGEGITVIDEAKDSISMPTYDKDTFPEDLDAAINLPEPVVQQLHDYVSIICSMYSKYHSFHNYQHASHVTMNVVKLLSRIVSPPTSPSGKNAETSTEDLYERTFGIAQCAMTQFALAFAALVHDVDHPGVRNAQLVREGSRMARIFQNISVTQQNSFTCAWDLLMDPCFKDLRTTIYTNKQEFDHFRELVVTAILATDLRDEELQQERNVRWDKAFPANLPLKENHDDGRTCATSSSSSSTNSGKKKANADRKAALIIECIMQASDVSHTMQHWHIFRKWNERSFLEKGKAYQDGRALTNPCDNFYEEVLSFFDSIVLPLAVKLKESGVFGSYSDEYLNFAKKNRDEWKQNGIQIVEVMKQNFAEKHNDRAPRTPSRSLLQGPGVGNQVAGSGITNGPIRTLRRSQSNEDIHPTFDNADADVPRPPGSLKRRASVDAAPKTPRRSGGTTDMEDPIKVVQAMFAQKFPGTPPSPSDDGKKRQYNRRKSNDGAPLAPRRSRDSVEFAEILEKVHRSPGNSVGEGNYGAPLAPRRSRDSVEFSEILDKVRRSSENSGGVGEGRKSPDVIPRPPSRSSNSSSVMGQPNDAENSGGVGEGRKTPDIMPRAPSRSSNSSMTGQPNDDDGFLAACNTGDGDDDDGGDSFVVHRPDINLDNIGREKQNDERNQSTKMEASSVCSHDDDESTLLTLGKLTMKVDTGNDSSTIFANVK